MEVWTENSCCKVNQENNGEPTRKYSDRSKPMLRLMTLLGLCGGKMASDSPALQTLTQITMSAACVLVLVEALACAALLYPTTTSNYTASAYFMFQTYAFRQLIVGPLLARNWLKNSRFERFCTDLDEVADLLVRHGIPATFKMSRYQMWIVCGCCASIVSAVLLAVLDAFVLKLTPIQRTYVAERFSTTFPAVEVFSYITLVHTTIALFATLFFFINETHMVQHLFVSFNKHVQENTIQICNVRDIRRIHKKLADLVKQADHCWNEILGIELLAVFALELMIAYYASQVINDTTLTPLEVTLGFTTSILSLLNYIAVQAVIFFCCQTIYEQVRQTLRWKLISWR